MSSAPILLVPGFWLGAWAWDDVVRPLRAEGHDVTALTLPGLESADADRSTITLSDHVDAICKAVKAAGRPVVLAVHSGAGVCGYGASDRVPEQVAAMVYVDSGPATGALDPGFDAVELPLPSWEELAASGSSLQGLTEQQLQVFRQRAVPEPGAALREGPKLTDGRRLDVPSTLVCSSITSDDIRAAVQTGWAGVGGLAELRHVTYLDLPTGHWPMWSRPQELATAIGDVARRVSTGGRLPHGTG
jgi:pimeloyl-ACP methyl ester carboxylesterase